MCIFRKHSVEFSENLIEIIMEFNKLARYIAIYLNYIYKIQCRFMWKKFILDWQTTIILMFHEASINTSNKLPESTTEENIPLTNMETKYTGKKLTRNIQDLLHKIKTIPNNFKKNWNKRKIHHVPGQKI